jgi:hypothetical protein
MSFIISYCCLHCRERTCKKAFHWTMYSMRTNPYIRLTQLETWSPLCRCTVATTGHWSGRYPEGTRCYAKVICHIPDYIIVCVYVCVLSPPQENVVGLHVMGPSAGEVFQGFAVALRCGLIKQQLDTPVRLHPVCAQVSTPVSLPLHCNKWCMVNNLAQNGRRTLSKVQQSQINCLWCFSCC